MLILFWNLKRGKKALTILLTWEIFLNSSLGEKLNFFRENPYNQILVITFFQVLRKCLFNLFFQLFSSCLNLTSR